MADGKDLSKFMANPEPFRGGKDNKYATTWFKSMDQLRQAVQMKDKEALFVAASYLKGPAELWWDNLEEQIKT
ncbi:hypothetical protein BDF14DRAFT_1786469 [Spinellus fusiger]|nr:hypothetical protein BDF14DRAFT_1786469 [Spinellus fusiger]